MLRKIKLGGRLVGEGEPIFIVAEVANTHEGKFDTAIKMVERAVGIGVDAVKFQMHIPEAEMIKAHPKYVTQGKRALSIAELVKLKRFAESGGLHFLCTPFSRQAADQLEDIGVGVFKIGSGEMTDLPFLEYVAKKGKPIILSTGMSDWHEVEEAVKLIKIRYQLPLLLVHCVSVYPPEYRMLNLGVIKRLREYFGGPVGLSDHTPEIFSSIAAIPYGISFLEKHYTLDRKQIGTSDHRVSIEPQEFRMLVDGVRKIELACGNTKAILDEERPVIEWARHAVVSLKDIPAGNVIYADAVSTKRPLYDGIPAKYLSCVIGRKARNDIAGDSLIRWEDLE